MAWIKAMYLDRPVLLNLDIVESIMATERSNGRIEINAYTPSEGGSSYNLGSFESWQEINKVMAPLIRHLENNPGIIDLDKEVKTEDAQ
jgi:hypothetical protein